MTPLLLLGGSCVDSVDCFFLLDQASLYLGRRQREVFLWNPPLVLRILLISFRRLIIASLDRVVVQFEGGRVRAVMASRWSRWPLGPQIACPLAMVRCI